MLRCVDWPTILIIVRRSMTWRRGGDSNPRCRFTPHNRLAICPVQPLQHLSATTYGHHRGPWRPNGDHDERPRRIPWSAFGLATVLPGVAERFHPSDAEEQRWLPYLPNPKILGAKIGALTACALVCYHPSMLSR